MTAVVAVVAAVLGLGLVGSPIRRHTVRRLQAPTPRPPSRLGAIAGRAGRRAGEGFRRRRRQRRGHTPDGVAAWCDSLSRRLRSGATLRETLLLVVPDDEHLAAATDELRRRLERGVTLSEAVDDERSDGPGSQHVATVRSVLVAAAEMGGSAAEPLDRTAALLRLRAADQHERAAQSAQAKMSALVLTVVPLGALGILLLTDAEVRRVVASTSGAALVGVGLLLNLVGARWMRLVIDGGR